MFGKIWLGNMLHTFIYIQNLVTQDEDFLRNTFPMQREKSIFVTSYPVRGGGGETRPLQ